MGYKNNKEVKYFNFPICFIPELLKDLKGTLDNVVHYAIYERSLSLELGNEFQAFKDSIKFYGITLNNPELSFEQAEGLYDSIPENIVKVGLNRDILFDYYKSHKTDFQIFCLMAFLGLKSIIQNKAYQKVTNNFWLNRVAGKNKVELEIEELPNHIKKYTSNYQLRKVKEELENNWYLKQYAITRGFYISFSMSYKNLIYEAEKKKATNKTQELKKYKKELKKQARLKLSSQKF